MARQILAGGIVYVVDVSLRDVFVTSHDSGDDSLLNDSFTSLPRGATMLRVVGKALSVAGAWCLVPGA